MNMMQDPWFIGMIITLILFFIVLGAALLPHLRDLLILAMALPPVLFKKLFGDPPAEDDAH